MVCNNMEKGQYLGWAESYRHFMDADDYYGWIIIIVIFLNLKFVCSSKYPHLSSNKNDPKTHSIQLFFKYNDNRTLRRSSKISFIIMFRFRNSALKCHTRFVLSLFVTLTVKTQLKYFFFAVFYIKSSFIR